MPCHAMADEPAGPHALPAGPATATNCTAQDSDNWGDEMINVYPSLAWRGAQEGQRGEMRALHAAGKAASDARAL